MLMQVCVSAALYLQVSGRIIRLCVCIFSFSFSFSLCCFFFAFLFPPFQYIFLFIVAMCHLNTTPKVFTDWGKESCWSTYNKCINCTFFSKVFSHWGHLCWINHGLLLFMWRNSNFKFSTNALDGLFDKWWNINLLHLVHLASECYRFEICARVTFVPIFYTYI